MPQSTPASIGLRKHDLSALLRAHPTAFAVPFVKFALQAQPGLRVGGSGIGPKFHVFPN